MSRKGADLDVECKAIYTSVLGNLETKMRSVNDLEQLLLLSGRNASRRVLDKHWSPSTKTMTYQDFFVICEKESVTSNRDLMRAFRAMDSNDDGFVSQEEFLLAMTKKGEKLSKEDVLQVIRRVDRNKDGKLDYKEFCDMILSNVDTAKAKAVENYQSAGKGPEPAPRPRRGRTSDTEEDDIRKPRRSRSARRVVPVSDDSDDEIIIGSSTSLRKPSGKDSKGSVTFEKKFGLSASMKEPKTLKRWTQVSRRGCFFYDEKGLDESMKSTSSSRKLRGDDNNSTALINHSFVMNLDQPSNIFITMDLYRDLKMLDLPQSPDMGFVVVKDKQVLAISDLGSKEGAVYARADLPAGTYRILPFTSGAKFQAITAKQRQAKATMKDATLLKKDRNGKFQLTTGFKDALTDIFQLSDNDCNGCLSKQEFSLYNVRTCGEALSDDLWEIVEENCKLVNGEIALEDFLHLNLLEALEDDGNTENLWITLESMGFNRQLSIDQAVPFVLHIYAEECKNIRVQTIEYDPALKENVDVALADYAISRGEKLLMADVPYCPIYVFSNDNAVFLAAQNKEKRGDITLLVDAGGSTNLLLAGAKQGKVEKSIAAGKFELVTQAVADKVGTSVSCFIKVSKKV